MPKKKGKQRGAAVEGVQSWDVPFVPLAPRVALTADSPLAAGLRGLEAMAKFQTASMGKAGAGSMGAEDREAVAAVFKAVAEDGRPKGLLCNARKSVHCAAREALLASHSYNDGKHRWICVQRPVAVPAVGGDMTAFVWFLGHVELAGSQVDLAALAGSAGLPQHMQQKRRQRDGPRHHITLVSPPEIAVSCHATSRGGGGNRCTVPSRLTAL